MVWDIPAPVVRRRSPLIWLLVGALILVMSLAHFDGLAKIDTRIATAMPGVLTSDMVTPVNERALSGPEGQQVAQTGQAIQTLIAAPAASSYNKPHGRKWIDINLSNFKVTLYEGTTKVHQFLSVTGAPKTPTISGTFYVYKKYAVKDMQGTNADGSKWFVANVQWVEFFVRGFAIHAAPWRSTFGYQASHGCVNLPTKQAKIVYDWAPVGTRVVVHK